MALSLLRNGNKFNALGAAFIRSGQNVPFNAYRTFVNNQRTLIANQIQLPKNVQFSIRKISLSGPRFSGSHDNHTTLWTMERVLILGMLGIIPTAFLYPSKALDAALATSIILHTHWGVDAMAGDYLRPNNVGPGISKMGRVAVFFLSVASLSGLFYLIYNDIGLVETVKKVWAIKGGKPEEEEEQ